ncbi:MAG: hypothetical protein GY909_13920 [Oligoflexia bacterium]|nr:hypothetical protein [Oligoflexia bacterium]
MSKVTIGISCFYHDAAVTFSQNGNILFAASEERFSRIKHDKDFPILALEQGFKYLNLKTEQVEDIIFYDKPYLKLERLLDSYFYNAPFGLKFFINSIPSFFSEKLFIKSTIRKKLKPLGLKDKKISFCEHHLSHAASAFLPSPFESANILCADGVGEWATTSCWQGTKDQIKPLWQINYPHSLGLFYSAFTYFCGFKVNSGEYKLMGLAPYGEDKYSNLIKDNIVMIDREKKSFRLNLDFFSFDRSLTMTSEKFEEIFKVSRRNEESNIDQVYKDIAASAQAVLEEIMILLVNRSYEENPNDNLVLAGGVALNCVMNTKLRNNTPYKNIWIQPAAGDAGGSLGCALYLDFIKKQAKVSQTHSFHGKDYSEEEILTALKNSNFTYSKLSSSEKVEFLKKQILNDKVIGLFQGRSEFGPRALGNRSILANAKSSQMKEVLNSKIKKREDFRPFAPIVREDKYQLYFDKGVENEFMLFTSLVKGSDFPAITHVNSSARVQTVNSTNHPLLFDLLSSDELPIIVNTSFNIRGEAIVETPHDALKTFEKANLDYLIIGDYLVEERSS